MVLSNIQRYREKKFSVYVWRKKGGGDGFLPLTSIEHILVNGPSGLYNQFSFWTTQSFLLL